MMLRRSGVYFKYDYEPADHEAERMEYEGGTAYLEQRRDMVARRWCIAQKRMHAAMFDFQMIDADWRKLRP